MPVALAHEVELPTEGQLAQRLATDRNDAQRRVRELFGEREPSLDGVRHQVPFGLNSARAGSS